MPGLNVLFFCVFLMYLYSVCNLPGRLCWKIILFFFLSPRGRHHQVLKWYRVEGRVNWERGNKAIQYLLIFCCIIIIIMLLLLFLLTGVKDNKLKTVDWQIGWGDGGSLGFSGSSHSTTTVTRQNTERDLRGIFSYFNIYSRHNLHNCSFHYLLTRWLTSHSHIYVLMPQPFIERISSSILVLVFFRAASDVDGWSR